MDKLKQEMNIVFSSGIDRIVEGNSSFDKGVLRICYAGENRNKVFISKETIEKCADSMYNCPIVCHYIRDTDGIGSHDMEIVSDDDGSMRLVNLTQPIGVIPQGASYWWEEIEDEGETHEYLCADALLWKRQEAYRKIKDESNISNSMEISIKDGEAREDGFYVVRDFEFTAFCLLGSEEPCFESAALQLFSNNRETPFKKQLAAMLEEAKQFSMSRSEAEKENKREEVNDVPDRSKQSRKDFVLDSNLREELSKGLKNGPKISREENQCLEGLPKYSYCDHDAQLSEVYVFDYVAENLYGLAYEIDEDTVRIDFSSTKRMKLAIVPFIEGQDSSNDTVDLNDVFAMVKTEIQKQEFGEKEALKNKLSEMESLDNEKETELCSLRKYKEDNEIRIEEENRKAVLAEFSDMSGIEEFDNLRSNHAQFSVEDLREKCYAIRGRNSKTLTFSVGKKPLKFPVGTNPEETEPEPYNGIFTKYGFSTGK